MSQTSPPRKGRADHRSSSRARHRRMRSDPGSGAGLRWEGLDRLVYKQDGRTFKEVTRQLLFDAPHELTVQLRYFEIAAGGYTSLEKHAHAHAVLVLCGHGRALVSSMVHTIAPFDLIEIPPWSWHQFRADPDAILGFLCLVPSERDRPVYPTQDELEAMRNNALVRSFIRF